MEEKILDYDRDWDELKNLLFPDLPEEERDGMLAAVVRMAIFN